MAQLAKRLGETGAMNKLDQAREQAFYSDLTTRLASARQRASRERERLIRALGLWGSDLDFALPKALPALPKRALSPAGSRARCGAPSRRSADRTHRARYAGEGLRPDQGHALHQCLGCGLRGQDHQRQGNGRHASATAASRCRSKFRCSISARRGCGRPNRPTCRRSTGSRKRRSTCARRRATPTATIAPAYDIASHYQRDVLPLRKIISDEMMLRYSAMQIDVFTLLARGAAEARRERGGGRRAARLLARKHRFVGGDCRRRNGWRLKQQISPMPAPVARPATNNDKEKVMISRRNLIGGSADSRRRSGGQRPRAGRRYSRGRHLNLAGHAAAARSVERARLSAGRHPQWLDAAVAHERRLEGIPSRR